MWASLQLGIQLNCRVYKSFCCSLFSFLWQLEDIPTSILELEKWAFRRLVPGPGNWVQSRDLTHLSSYGYPFEFPSMEHSSLAAKVRVFSKEPQINCQNLHSELLHAFATASMKRLAWDDWYARSYVLKLYHANEQAEKLGITFQKLRREVVHKLGEGTCKTRIDECLYKWFQLLVYKNCLGGTSIITKACSGKK